MNALPSSLQTAIMNAFNAVAAQASSNGQRVLTTEEKRAMLRLTANNAEAFNNFVQSQAAVVNPIVEEQSTVRGIFRPVQLGPGESPRYDINFDDIDCVWTMPKIGGIPTVQVEGAEITVGTFGVHGGVEWQMDVAKDGRIDVVNESIRRLASKFTSYEELAGWGLIKTHAAALPAAQKLQALDAAGATPAPGSGLFNIYTLNMLYVMADEIGKGGRRVTDIYLSPRRFNDMRNLVNTAALPDELRQQLWANGQGPATAGAIRLHKVYNTSLVPNNKAYVFVQRDGVTYGVMPIRDEVSTIPNPISILENKQGILGRARYGMGILDDKGLIEVTF